MGGVPPTATGVERHDIEQRIVLFPSDMSAAALVQYMKSARNVADMCASNQIQLRKVTQSRLEKEQRQWNFVLVQQLVQSCAFMEAHYVLSSVQDDLKGRMLAVAVRAVLERHHHPIQTVTRTFFSWFQYQLLRCVQRVCHDRPRVVVYTLNATQRGSEDQSDEQKALICAQLALLCRPCPFAAIWGSRLENPTRFAGAASEQELVLACHYAFLGVPPPNFQVKNLEQTEFSRQITRGDEEQQQRKISDRHMLRQVDEEYRFEMSCSVPKKVKRSAISLRGLKTPSSARQVRHQTHSCLNDSGISLQRISSVRRWQALSLKTQSLSAW